VEKLLNKPGKQMVMQMAKDTESQTEHDRGIKQLLRLERIIDVVYAIVIWRIFMLIPKPAEANWAWDAIGPFLFDNILTFILAFIAVAIIIIFWIQNNVLLGNLERTDGRHTALSILQIFFLLLFLLSIRLGINLGGSAGTRVLESTAAAFVGISSTWAWAYARKNRRLISDDLSDAEARRMLDRTLAEPAAAIITIPCAFIGPWAWELAWLSLIPITQLLKRRRRKQRREVETNKS
jgi:uncharacterized membrane protein